MTEEQGNQMISLLEEMRDQLSSIESNTGDIYQIQSDVDSLLTIANGKS